MAEGLRGKIETPGQVDMSEGRCSQMDEVDTEA